jgi:hypothetical protein
MQEEYDSLVANGTWELNTILEGSRSVECKWVFRTKHDASGIRPDLAFAVSTVSQFIAKAGPPHWMAVKHFLRYLKGSLELKL